MARYIDVNNAIKEFTERLKKQYDEYKEYDDIYVRHIRDSIDFLVDEYDRRGQIKDEKNT